MLGVFTGAVRGFGQYKIHEMYDFEKPETMIGHTLDLVGSEALTFALLGPVQFMRGGSSGSIIARTKDMTRGIVNSMRPIKKLTPEQMETQVGLLYAFSSGNIGSNLKSKLNNTRKWASKSDDWFVGSGKLSAKTAEGKYT